MVKKGRNVSTNCDRYLNRMDRNCNLFPFVNTSANFHTRYWTITCALLTKFCAAPSPSQIDTKKAILTVFHFSFILKFIS